MSPALDLLLRNVRPDGHGAVDIACRDGSIVQIGSLGERAASRVVDCRGRAVTPGLVDAHIHLDKALLSARAPSVHGTLDEALSVTAAAKRGFTVEDIRARARAVLDLAVGHGTTAMRSHVEVDPIFGLTALEALMPLREEYRPAIDLELCAFAQEGILKMPGTEALLARALREGADLVGGCPYNDTDARAQIDIVFRLATEFGVHADFHVDFFDEPDHLDVRYIAEQTVRRGWQGKVAVGHVTELGALPPAHRDVVIREIRDAGLGVIVLPATDLYLMGRRDGHRVRRGLAPVKHLLEAGVPVAAATNNVRNAFTPVGTADLALMGLLVSVGCHMGSRADLESALAMLTTHPSRILGRGDAAIAPGARADLVVWDTERAEDVIAAMAPRHLVVKRGHVTVEHTREIAEPWRAR